MKRIISILVLILVLAVVGISGCTSSSSSSGNGNSSYSTNSTNQGTWHSVANFTGSGDKKTAPFTIQGSKFKVVYSITREETGFGLFYLFVYPEGDSVSYVAHANLNDESQLTQKDETYVYEGSGSYYCDIGASNMKNWKVEVFDYY